MPWVRERRLALHWSWPYWLDCWLLPKVKVIGWRRRKSVRTQSRSLTDPLISVEGHGTLQDADTNQTV